MADPTYHVTLDDGRSMAVDDEGNQDGPPVLYLHGTPDSRLSCHPDALLRIIAVDRPGIGRSTSHPGRTLGSVADDLAEVLRSTEIREGTSVLAWSAGAPYAVAMAARHPHWVTTIGLVAPLVPITAYADPEVRAAAGPGRELFAEMAAEMAPDVVAAEVAPYLLADPATPESVAEQMAAEADPGRTSEITGHLVAAAVEAVALGREGLHQEVATQAAVPDVDLASAADGRRIIVWSGERDEISPPAFGRWWADLLGAEHVVVPDAGHALHLSHWREILDRLLVPGTSRR